MEVKINTAAGRRLDSKTMATSPKATWVGIDLTRIIHQSSTADGEALHSAVFSRLGVLNGLSSTPARLSGRKLQCAQHLAALVTNPGE